MDATPEALCASPFATTLFLSPAGASTSRRTRREIRTATASPMKWSSASTGRRRISRILTGTVFPTRTSLRGALILFLRMSHHRFCSSPSRSSGPRWCMASSPDRTDGLRAARRRPLSFRAKWSTRVRELLSSMAAGLSTPSPRTRRSCGWTCVCTRIPEPTPRTCPRTRRSASSSASRAAP